MTYFIGYNLFMAAMDGHLGLHHFFGQMLFSNYLLYSSPEAQRGRNIGPRSLCLGSLELEGFRPRRPCPHIGLTPFSLGGTSLSNYKQVLGPHHEVYEVERHPKESDIQFYVEGLAFPDTNFSGLISLSVSLVSTEVSAR